MYKNKYLKYKSKYLELKDKLSGGSEKAIPPVLPEHEEQENSNSALDDFASEITKRIHRECFSRIDIESIIQGRRWNEYLPELLSRKHKILLMGGLDFDDDATNRVDMMVIEVGEEDTKISWQECAPMVRKRRNYSASYCHGEVLSVSSDYGSERYDVLSQIAVELQKEMPRLNLHAFAMTNTIYGEPIIFGGSYKDSTGRDKLSRSIFCEQALHERSWENKGDLVTARRDASVIMYKGKYTKEDNEDDIYYSNYEGSDYSDDEDDKDNKDDKFLVAGGRDDNGLPLSSIERFVLSSRFVTGSSSAGNLTKARSGSIALFEINDKLFAAGGTSKGTWVEKYNKRTETWQLVSELKDGNRYSCALAACGSTIYFLGGNVPNTSKSWNSFNTLFDTWASQYQDVSKRQLPRPFTDGQAVCITPDEQSVILSRFKAQLSNRLRTEEEPTRARHRKEEEVRRKEEKREANRVYQATRAYANAPVFPEHDERHKTHEYALTHLAQTMTKKPILHNIGSFLEANDLAQLSQTRKVINTEINKEKEELIVKRIHQRSFSRIPFGSMEQAKGPRTWAEYLTELVNDRSHKILLMGGDDDHESDGGSKTNSVYMMVINDGIVTWKLCLPMIRKRSFHSAYYCKGQVLSVSGDGKYNHAVQGTSERYDVFSQTSVELAHKLPIPTLSRVALAELDNKVFAIGGLYVDDDEMYANAHVFCLDIDRELAGQWIKQKAKLSIAGFTPTAATYKGNIWATGGKTTYYDSETDPNVVEVFDPLVGSWQASGNLESRSHGKITLFVIKDDLFAVCEHTDDILIEKLDRQTGLWQIISEFYDESRVGCGMAACDSTIYFIGGLRSSTIKSWNSFDTRTNTWASQHQPVSTRQMPISFSRGQAVCITPDEQLAVLSEYAGLPPEP
jgi:hypothetical protein